MPAGVLDEIFADESITSMVSGKSCTAERLDMEAEARTILNRGIDVGSDKMKRETALRMLRDGELPIEKIAEYTGLDVTEIEHLVER